MFPLIGIFGANASGKSNVLAALTDMSRAVRNSYAHWASYDGVPRQAFALDAKEEEEPTFFEADLAIDGVRWTYGFELGSRRVEAEWLHSYPRGHRQVWLDGTGRMSLGWPHFQLPMHLVDYIVAHELAHVRVPGHGTDFWRLLGRALPEYEERTTELDELGRRMWMGEIAR